MSKKNNQDLSSIKIKNFFKNNMIFIVIITFVGLIALFVLINTTKTQEQNFVYGDDIINMYYFYLSTCPHCHEQEKFHPILLEKYPNLKIISYEIKAKESQDKYHEFATKIGGADPNQIGTPTTFIGKRSNVGFGTPETTGQVLLHMIAQEQARIDATWDEDTMTRTVDLRAQLEK